MKIRFYIFFTLLPIFGISQTQANLRSEIDKIVRFDTEISYELTPGFIIGIIDNDSTYILSFGKSLSSASKSLTSEDVFEIASLTKTFTVSLIYALEKDGALKLSDKVNDFLPQEYQNPRFKNLFIKDLINQSVDFPKRPTMFGEFEDDPQNPYSRYGKSDLLQFYKTYVPEIKNGFNYSHINFALLELVAENAAKKDFEMLITDKLFKPLGMTNSFIHYKEKKTDIITPGIDLSLQSVSPWTFNSFAGSEGMKSSVNDLLKFTRSFFSDKQTNLGNTNLKYINEKIPSFNEDLYYASGWYSININKKTRVLACSGRTNGHSSFVGMVPENNTSVVVLSNSSYGTFDLGMLVLRMVNNNWKRKPQQ